MTTYESTIKTISANNEMVFAKLADLRNLESLKEKLPSNTPIQDLEVDIDSIHFSIQPIGKMGLRIIDRSEFSTIKLEAENSPINFNTWIQLVPINEDQTKLKITLKAELPMMIKMMLGNKLEDFVNQLAEALTKIDY